MLWSSQTQSARMAIVYITAGALIDVWTALYYFLIMRPEHAKNPDASGDSSLFWVAGFFFSGLALLVIGILVGRIGRAAGEAEVAPSAAATMPVTTNTVPPGTVPAAMTDLRQQAAVAPVQNVGPIS